MNKTVPVEFEQKKPVCNDALWLLARLAQDFPGLLDNETEVCGGDLVDFLSYQIENLDQLKDFMSEYYEGEIGE